VFAFHLFSLSLHQPQVQQAFEVAAGAADPEYWEKKNTLRIPPVAETLTKTSLSPRT